MAFIFEDAQADLKAVDLKEDLPHCCGHLADRLNGASRPVTPNIL